jgi:hypothetical protein
MASCGAGWDAVRICKKCPYAKQHRQCRPDGMHRWCWLFLLSHYRSVKREDETLKAMNDAESQAPRGSVELNLKGKMRFRTNFRGNAPGAAHEHGKTLFAQLMDFPPWTTFTYIVHRQSVTAT